MPKMALAELEKLARPALQYAELVALARDPGLTPDKVQATAISRRWPIRQAKAARSLAMVRRDWGLEALEAFITRMEHARTAVAVTEHAQKERSMSNDDEETRRRERQKAAINRLTDPRAKLQLMIKHNLAAEAGELITGLVNTSQVSFTYCEGRGKTFFLPPAGEPADTTDHTPHLVLVEAMLNPTEQSCLRFHLDGLATFLGWDRERLLTFIRPLVEKIVATNPVSREGVYGAAALAQVVRRYLTLDSDRALANQGEIWALRGRLHEGRPLELRLHALPRPMENAEDATHELDPIVDRFLELGWTEEQVRAELLLMLSLGISLSFGPLNVLAIAGAKCFKHDDPARKEMLRTRYLQRIWHTYFQRADSSPAWILKAFDRLGRIGLWESRTETRGRSGSRTPIDNDRAFFRSEIVWQIADGKVGKAYQLLLAFGRGWGLFSSEPGADYRISAAKQYFVSLLPDAFGAAYEYGKYGIAAALVQHFGSDHCLGEKWLWHNAELLANRQAAIAEVTQLAMDLEQPMRLDPFYYLVMPDWTE